VCRLLKEIRFTVMKFVIIVIVFLFIRCGSFDKKSREVRKDARIIATGKILFVARSNSDIKRYFTFRENGFFSYMEYDLCKKCQAKYYAGYYKENDDTIFLKFIKGWEPVGISHYILKENGNQKLKYYSVAKGAFELLDLKYF
jgi:hypothetical protein